MKKLATFVLYVSSIVLAIGIGMYQVGAVSNPELPLGSGGPGCYYSGEQLFSCYTVTQGACSIGSAYNAVMPVPQHTNNPYKQGGQRLQYTCSGTGCPHNASNPVKTIALAWWDCQG